MTPRIVGEHSILWGTVQELVPPDTGLSAYPSDVLEGDLYQTRFLLFILDRKSH